MRVFIASGYYDLVTPATAVDQCLQSSNVDMDRVTHKNTSPDTCYMSESQDKNFKRIFENLLNYANENDCTIFQT